MSSPFGSSSSHIPPQLPTISVALGGQAVKVTAAYRPSNRAPTRRGKVLSFSSRSRQRLLRRLNSIDRRQLAKAPLFVTLTYPCEWSQDADAWKRDLDVWWKRLRREYPHAAGIWRLEAQERGAPHFHVLIWGVHFLPYQWLALAWYETVGSGDPDHLDAGTSVERCRNWRHATAYAAKYLAKETVIAVPLAWGRLWGILSRADLPCSVVTVQLHPREYYRVRRAIYRWLASKGIRRRYHRRGGGVFGYLPWEAGVRLVSWVTSTAPEGQRCAVWEQIEQQGGMS